MHDLDLIQPSGSPQIIATYYTRERLAIEREQPHHRTRIVRVHTIKVTVEWWPGLPEPSATVNVYGDVLKKDGTPGLQPAMWTIRENMLAEEKAARNAALREFRRTYAPILPEHLQPENEGTQP